MKILRILVPLVVAFGCSQALATPHLLQKTKVYSPGNYSKTVAFLRLSVDARGVSSESKVIVTYSFSGVGDPASSEEDGQFSGLFEQTLKLKQLVPGYWAAEFQQVIQPRTSSLRLTDMTMSIEVVGQNGEAQLLGEYTARLKPYGDPNFSDEFEPLQVVPANCVSALDSVNP